MHRKMSCKLYIIYTFVIIAVILSFAGCSGEKEECVEELTELRAAEEVPEEEVSKGEGSEEEEFQEERKEEVSDEEEIQEPAQGESGTICIHVCGRVAHPGVYVLPSGSRIYEAVEAAGGLSEDAAGELLNQAAQMEDGQQIYVPSREEAEQGITGGKSQADSPGAKPAAGDTEAKDGRVSINTASKEQLMTLNGIGEAKAAAIIRYREEHGGFQKIEELKEVEGIKEGVFNKVKDQIII